MKRMVILLAACAMLLACVPTPEEDFIKNKSDNVLEESLTVTAAPDVASGELHETLAQRLGAPERWTEEPIQKKIPYGILTLCIDAEVHIPDTDRVGVYTATMDPPFSETQQKALIQRYFGENAPLFRCARDTERKWKYVSQIQSLQEEIEQIDANRDDPYREEMLAERNGVLEYIMEQYRNAPDDYPHRDWNGEYASGHGPNRKVLSVDTSTDLYAHYRTIWLESLIFTFNDESLESGVDTDRMRAATPAQIIEPQTDWERRAAEMALNELAALGLGEFAVKEVLTSDAAPNGKNTETPGAAVELLPMTDGLPTYSFRVYHGNDNAVQGARDEGYLEEREYNIELQQCTAEIRFHGETVSFLRIGYPGTVTGCVNRNVQLLPFSEIQKIFLEQAPLRCFVGSPDEPSDEIGAHIYVTDVYLSMMRVRKKDSDDELYLLPVWDFGFYEIDDSLPIEIQEHRQEFFSADTMLTINAIDGTIIDRDRGY